jgi:hypothetical protein
MSESKKQYRAKMRAKHGADWWKKAKKAPAKKAKREAFKIRWPNALRTKDGVVLRYVKTGYGAHLYSDNYDEYSIRPTGGGKYSLVWSEEDLGHYEELDDASGSEWHPEEGEIADKTILKSATPAQIKKKIEGTNRPRLIKYNRGRRR